MTGKYTKHWCLTLNNYTQQEQDILAQLCNSDKVTYAVIGKEVGESGTPHLQMHISFTKKLRLTSVKKLTSTRVHCEPNRGTPLESSTYCKKEGDFDEYGSVPVPQRGRTDLMALIEAVEEGLSNEELSTEHASAYAKYYKYVAHRRAIINEKKSFDINLSHPLNAWQQDLNKKLNGPIEDRVIYFVVDYKGNAGKTWFAKYYSLTHPDTKVQLLKPAKSADLAYELKTDNRVILFDCPRAKMEYLQYDFLENIKDGLVFSPKYESTTKRLDKCHVVCFMNEQPDFTKLSGDRYVCIAVT